MPCRMGNSLFSSFLHSKHGRQIFCFPKPLSSETHVVANFRMRLEAFSKVSWWRQLDNVPDGSDID